MNNKEIKKALETKFNLTTGDIEFEHVHADNTVVTVYGDELPINFATLWKDMGKDFFEYKNGNWTYVGSKC